MTDDTKIEKHIDECKRRIDTIMGYMASNSDANKSICDENISVLTLAIKTLEKQMPKKVYHFTEDDTFETSCCGIDVSNEDFKYCPECGQLLGEVEEVIEDDSK